MTQNAAWNNQLPGVILLKHLYIFEENVREWTKLLWNFRKMRLLNIYIKNKILNNWKKANRK